MDMGPRKKNQVQSRWNQFNGEHLKHAVENGHLGMYAKPKDVAFECGWEVDGIVSHDSR